MADLNTKHTVGVLLYTFLAFTGANSAADRWLDRENALHQLPLFFLMMFWWSWPILAVYGMLHPKSPAKAREDATRRPVYTRLRANVVWVLHLAFIALSVLGAWALGKQNGPMIGGALTLWALVGWLWLPARSVLDAIDPAFGPRNGEGVAK